MIDTTKGNLSIRLRELLCDEWDCEKQEYIHSKLRENWLRKALEDAVKDLLQGQPELSPQTLRWLEKQFGFTIDGKSYEKQLGQNLKIISSKVK